MAFGFSTIRASNSRPLGHGIGHPADHRISAEVGATATASGSTKANNFGASTGAAAAEGDRLAIDVVLAAAAEARIDAGKPARPAAREGDRQRS